MAGFAEYEDYDAIGLAQLVAARQVTAAEVLEAAILRLEQRNPKINAVVATSLDEARAAAKKGPAGPLAGVPWLIKDLGALQSGQPTSQGSRLWDGFVADHDSTIVERWRQAGLLLMGKTNTPEFGSTATTEPARWGPTRNPWSPAHSAGGSSGGAAAAVAARILPAAHATDGGGSIRIPAACCGVFGLKPTRARNPAGPDVGEGWAGLATAHAVTISVRDSAALLDATHGPAPGDPYCAPAPARPFLAEAGRDPDRLRIAITTQGALGQAIDPEVKTAAEAAGRLCQELGHEVEEAVPDWPAEAAAQAMRTIMAANLAFMVDTRLAALGRTLQQGDIEPANAGLVEEGRRRTAAEYAAAVWTVHQVGRRFAELFGRYDILLSPVLAAPPQRLGTLSMAQDVDAYYAQLVAAIPFTPQFNMAGCPAMSVPLAWSRDGLPIGVQFGAGYGEEATLIRLAAQLEAAQPWRAKKPPVAA
jgi:amidase/6-aminohexanoate-cyclic-dimer hydrolase